MEGDDSSSGGADREENGSSTHSTPQEHRSFAEYAKDKLDTAGRELRRRLPMAGQIGAHLMHPRRLLLHSTTSQQTDVVLTFPKGLPDSMLLWLLQKLRGSRPRLRVCVRQHASSQCSAFYVTADEDALLQTAEEIHLPKQLKPEFGGGYKEFTVRDMHCFQKGTSVAELFNSQERASLVKHVLESVKAEPGDEYALEPAMILRLGQSIVPACVSRGVAGGLFPLHDRPALDSLRRQWVRSLLAPQPLDEISEYFGVQIAMYFAWLGHYTRSLTIPAVVGLVFWIWLGAANDNWKDIAHILFSLFNVLWACVYLETWKRYSNVLAYKWGTLDQRDDLLVEPRPLFQGEMSISPVTGREEPVYPAWKRRLWRHCVSCPVTVLCLCVCAATTAALLLAQFQFVNSFMSLFYIAFYLQDMDKLKEQLAVLLITRQIIGNLKESALPYLIENLRLAKICVDVFGALSPAKEPTSAQITSLFEKKTDSSSSSGARVFDASCASRRGSEPARSVHQAELEAQLFQYDGTFSEYLEMLTQLGHVVLFSSAFPLAAACALLNNAAEIRADAFKLCHVARRPFGVRVNSIGAWQHAMEAMVLVSVVVNCALVALSGPAQRLLPAAPPAHVLAAVVLLEHVILLAVLSLRLSIPELPAWLAQEMAKAEFRRREAGRGPPSAYPSQDDISKPKVTPTAPKPDEKVEKKKIPIGKISEIPPFRPKAASITVPLPEPPINTGSLQALQDVSPTKIIRHKEAPAPLSLLGVRKLRDEPLHRSAQCLPQPHRAAHPALQELAGSVSAGGSEPDLNAPAEAAEDDKPKDKGSRSRAKALLVKRMRTVAVFSLGLRRAREAAADRPPQRTPGTPDKNTSLGLPAPILGGELSLIPIEQLIQMEDVKPRPGQNNGS